MNPSCMEGHHEYSMICEVHDSSEASRIMQILKHTEKAKKNSSKHKDVLKYSSTKSQTSVQLRTSMFKVHKLSQFKSRFDLTRRTTITES